VEKIQTVDLDMALKKNKKREGDKNGFAKARKPSPKKFFFFQKKKTKKATKAELPLLARRQN
jgi:hypothetical protein